MEPHPLTTYTPRLIEGHGRPQVLDVEHSIQDHKPLLSGTISQASYYILPPSGMAADALIGWFESVPGFSEFRLTLVPILGLDTYHQPLISSDDFAKKHFHDSRQRVLRVVGKSNQAIAAMTAFIKALKRPFDASIFPHYGDFSVSGYKTAESGGGAELKLLFKPADYHLLMPVEHLVTVHLDECNLGREIGASRHPTRTQAPELILASTHEASAGLAYLDALANSLPRATPQEVAQATAIAQTASRNAVKETSSAHAPFSQPQVPTRVLPPHELIKTAIANLADILTSSRFAAGADVKLVRAGAAIEVVFPRTIGTLWIATSFREAKHIKEIANACVALRADPVLRDGWSALYKFDSPTGKLHIWATEAGSRAPDGWKEISQ